MSDPFIGQIMQVGFAYAPVNWLTCKGQTLAIGQNQALFALLGTRFGGNGTATFGLPDAQGRVFIGAGMGAGLPNYNLGVKGGQVNQTLTVLNLPQHNHTATATGGGVIVNAQLNAIAGTSTSNETAQPTAGARLGTVLEADTSPVLYVPADASGAPVPLGGLAVNAQYAPPAIVVQSTGQSQAFSIMPPYQAVTTIIATNGIWPENPN